MKSIVVYYSLEGNCKLIGNTVAETLHSPIIELKLRKPVPAKSPMKFIVGGRSAIKKTSPELSNSIPDLSDYELIVVGSPVWAGTFAPALRTFASKARIENKKIAFFACSGGGSTQKCISEMQFLFEGNDFIGDTSFVTPSLKDTENCIHKAQKWADSLILSL